MSSNTNTRKEGLNCYPSTVASSNQNYRSKKTLKDSNEIIIGDIQGQILKNQFLVLNSIDQGSFGSVYQCMDLKSPKEGLVIKISPNHKMMKREISSLNRIHVQSKFSKYSYPYDFVPKVVSKGQYIHERLSETQ